jgi:fibronectin type 3 domain-containing protein
MPGAARYNILRSTTSGSGYVSLASGQLGTVCGTDASINTYTDTTAVNNTTYYYVVQSWNVQNGYSPNSPQASGRPLSTLATSAPATPTITVSGSGSHSVNLSWSASAGANFYVLTRKTLADNNVGGAYVLRTITLDDHVTGTTHTNTAVSDGKLYDYSVKAVNAAGVSADSAPVMAEPLPAAPAAPAGLTATALSSTSVKLTWNAAANAIGYVIYRSTTSGGPYVFPANYVNSGVRTSLTDNDVVAGTTYYYRVTSVNAGAISPHSYVTVTTP